MTNVQFSDVPFSDVLRSTLEKNVHFSETLYHYAIRHVRTWKKNYNKRNKIEKQCKQLGKQRNKKNGCKLGMEIFPLQLHLHYRFKPNAVFFLPWENRRHSTTPTLVSPRNNVWGTSAEIPYRWRVTTEIWLAGNLLQLATSGSWHVISMEFLHSFLRRHLTGKPVAMTQISAFSQTMVSPDFAIRWSRSAAV